MHPGIPLPSDLPEVLLYSIVKYFDTVRCTVVVKASNGLMRIVKFRRGGHNTVAGRESSVEGRKYDLLVGDS